MVVRLGPKISGVHGKRGVVHCGVTAADIARQERKLGFEIASGLDFYYTREKLIEMQSQPLVPGAWYRRSQIEQIEGRIGRAHMAGQAEKAHDLAIQRCLLMKHGAR